MTTDTPFHWPSASGWTLEEVGFGCIDRKRARDDLLLYYLVTAASFVETAADLYTGNLVRHFPDPSARAWLAERWQPE